MVLRSFMLRPASGVKRSLSRGWVLQLAHGQPLECLDECSPFLRRHGDGQAYRGFAQLPDQKGGLIHAPAVGLGMYSPQVRLSSSFSAISCLSACIPDQMSRITGSAVTMAKY